MQASVLEQWHSGHPESPHLIGTRCGGCGSYYFPPQSEQCRHSSCPETRLAVVALSSHGSVWSFTHQPKAAASEPDGGGAAIVIAVELAREKLVVLGLAAAGTRFEQLRVGQPVRLVLEPLDLAQDDATRVWKWQPCSEAS